MKPLKSSALNDVVSANRTRADWLNKMIISRFKYVYPFSKFNSDNPLQIARAKSYSDVNSGTLMYQLRHNVKMILRLVHGVNDNQGLSLDITIIEG